MIFNDHNDYTTLVVSRDHSLFRQFSSFLMEFEPDRKPFLADHVVPPEKFNSIMKTCDMMLCDIRPDFTTSDLGLYTMQCAPERTLTIGITNDAHISDEILGLPQNVRLAGIIDTTRGWYSNWKQITTMKQAWNNPLMVSRIEDVQVYDILQMISSGQWSNVVYIEGFTGEETFPSTRSPLRGGISFYKGEPQTAWSWRSTGIEAMFDLLSIKHGILQVMKNLCLPTIRNIYQHMDEILLSHAVAQDESSISCPVDKKTSCLQDQSSPGPVVSNSLPSDDEPENNPVDAKKVPPDNFWKIIATAAAAQFEHASPQSFPCRWMEENDLKYIAQKHQNVEFLVIYGNESSLVSIFTSCAKKFSSQKFHNESQIPVMRIGRSGHPCLYIIGNLLTIRRTFCRNRHAILVTASSSEIENPLLQDLLNDPSLHIFSHDADTIQQEKVPLPSAPISFLPDLSWQNIKMMLTRVFSSVSDI